MRLLNNFSEDIPGYRAITQQILLGFPPKMSTKVVIPGFFTKFRKLFQILFKTGFPFGNCENFLTNIIVGISQQFLTCVTLYNQSIYLEIHLENYLEILLEVFLGVSSKKKIKIFHHKVHSNLSSGTPLRKFPRMLLQEFFQKLSQ